MADFSPLEDKVVSALQRANGIPLDARMKHILRTIVANPVRSVMLTAAAFFLYDAVVSAWHNYVVADKNVAQAVSNTKESFDRLSESLGGVLAPGVERTALATAQSRYIETTTHVDHLLNLSHDQLAQTLHNALTSHSGIFPPNQVGVRALEIVNESRPLLDQLKEKYAEGPSAILYILMAGLMGGVGVMFGKSASKNWSAGDEFTELKEAQREVQDGIEIRLPAVFSHLRPLSGHESILEAAIAYANIEHDPRGALHFLYIAREVPERVLEHVQTTEKPRNGRSSLTEIVRNVLAEFASADFDYGLMSFDKIGGYQDIKDQLRLYAAIFSDMKSATEHGVEGTTGFILEGPPGCGKTLLAQAFIREALKGYSGAARRRHYAIVSAADLRSMWYSKSEQNVRDFYVRARRNAPFIVFIDEGEELFSKRGAGPGTDNSVTNQLLTEIGGVNRSDQVITIITTNRLDQMDEAARRYGRLGVHYRIDVPNEEGRKEIARIHLKRFGRDALVDDFDLDRFVAATDGKSGADLAGIIAQVYWNRFQDLKLRGIAPYKLTTDHFVRAAEAYNPEAEKLGFGK